MKKSMVFVAVALLICCAGNAEMYVLQNGDAYFGCADTYLMDTTAESENNYGGSQLLICGKGGQTMMMKFDVGAFSTSTTIDSAALDIYLLYNLTAGSSTKYDAYKMLQRVDFGDSYGGPQEGAVCWAWREWSADTVTRVGWNADGSYNDGPVADVSYATGSKVTSQPLSASNAVWATIDLTTMVQEWIANPETNHGMIIFFNYYFGSSNFISTTYEYDFQYRPKLSIATSTAPTAAEVTSSANPAVTVEWNATIGNDYLVSEVNDLNDTWTVAEQVEADQTQMKHNDSFGDANKKFYRVEHVPYEVIEIE
jgi:hypothetical protein